MIDVDETLINDSEGTLKKEKDRMERDELEILKYTRRKKNSEWRL